MLKQATKGYSYGLSSNSSTSDTLRLSKGATQATNYLITALLQLRTTRQGATLATNYPTIALLKLQTT